MDTKIRELINRINVLPFRNQSTAQLKRALRNVQEDWDAVGVTGSKAIAAAEKFLAKYEQD